MPRQKETPKTIPQEVLTHDGITRMNIDFLSDGTLNISMEDREGFLDGQNFLAKEGTGKSYLALNVVYDLEPLGDIVRAAHAERIRIRDQRPPRGG